MNFLYIFVKNSIISFLKSVQCGLSYSMCTDEWTDSHYEPNIRFTEICVVHDIVQSVIDSTEQIRSRQTNRYSVVKKCPSVYGIGKFIIAVTSARHQSLS